MGHDCASDETSLFLEWKGPFLFFGKEQNASECTAAYLLLEILSRVTPGSVMGKQFGRMEMSDPMVSIWEKWPFVPEASF